MIDIPGMAVTLIGNAESLVAAYAQSEAAAQSAAAVIEESSATMAAAAATADEAVASGAVAMDAALAATAPAAEAAAAGLVATGAAADVMAGEEVVATGATATLGAAMDTLLLNPVVAIMAAIVALTGAAFKLESTYEDLEHQTALLAAATTAHGMSAQNIEASIESNAAAYARQGASISDVRGAITSLISANLSEAQSFASLPAILDLAAAKGISVSAATEMFTRAIAGGARGFADMGLQLTKIHGDMTDYGTSMLGPTQMSERLATLTGGITGQLGNASQATTAQKEASIELGNAWDKLSTQVGPPLVAIITTIVGALTAMVSIVSAVVQGVESLISAIQRMPGEWAIADLLKGFGMIGDFINNVPAGTGTFGGSSSEPVYNQLAPGLVPGQNASGYASGGPVAAGVPITVGERGPEIYVPGQAGTIIPNGGSGAGAGSPVTLNVYNPTPEPASTSIARELQKLASMGYLEPTR